MATVSRSGGVELHWEAHGSGPPVVLAAYWSVHPSTFDRLIEELAGDHRVVLYHDRGTGSSTRTGPYDMETSADDLAAVLAAAGGDAAVICTADAGSRAVRVAARHPQLVRGVIHMGAAPVGRRVFADSDALAASDTVVDAQFRQVETDYRGALRSLVTATNPQMSEEELRERVSALIEFCPHDAAVARLRAWIDDDPTELAKALGDRLWIAVSERLGGGWFPAGDELEGRVRESLPQARIEHVDDGFVSRPDQTAAIVRKVMAERGALEHAE
jgi:pimeloyl-ACP methyl ester carboxylesterase